MSSRVLASQVLSPRTLSKFFVGEVIICRRFAPAATAYLAKCETAGMSTSGNISLATAAVAGSILAPTPPATITASSTAAIVILTSPLLSSVAPPGLVYGRKG